jgi:surface protein
MRDGDTVIARVMQHYKRTPPETHNRVYRIDCFIMTVLRLDRIITSIGLTIGISVHLYMAFLAVANSFPNTLMVSNQYNQFTSLAITEPVTVSRPQLDWDVGINLSVQQKTDLAVFVDTYDLKQAIDLWIVDKKRAQRLYGHISNWNVSAMMDMSLLFRGAASFSEDLSQWDVSLVRNMSGMFHDASQFQSNLSSWQVSNVKDFSHMFHGATSFDGDVSTWEVLSAVDYSFMFCDATSFQGDLSTWMTGFNKDNYIDYSYSNLRPPVVSKESPLFLHAQNMESMFENAISFDSKLALWETGAVVNMRAMFRNAIHFKGGDLSDWNVSAVRDFGHMFDGADIFSGQLCWRVTDGADTTDMLKGSPGSFQVDCDDAPRIIAEASFDSTYSSAITQRWNAFTGIFASRLVLEHSK